MSLLGSVGSLYMFFLIVLMIIGFGMAGLRIIEFVSDYFQGKNIAKPAKEDNKYANRYLGIAAASFISILILAMLSSIFVSNMGTYRAGIQQSNTQQSNSQNANQHSSHH